MGQSFTIAEAYDAVAGQINREFQDDPVLDTFILFYSDIDGEPPEGTENWIRLNMRNATGGQATLAGEVGTQRFRRTGVLTFQIFSDLGDGELSAQTASQSILDIFDGVAIDGIWFRDGIDVPVGVSGKWFQTNVTFAYEYDQIK